MATNVYLTIYIIFKEVPMISSEYFILLFIFRLYNKNVTLLCGLLLFGGPWDCKFQAACILTTPQETIFLHL